MIRHMSGTRRDLIRWFARRLTARRAHPRLVRASSRVHVVLFRMFGGSGGFGVNTLILITRGRTTGRPRSTPVNYIEQSGALFVAASFAGNTPPPQWYLNLKSDPTVQVEIGSCRATCSARIVTDDGAETIWPKLTAMDPLFTLYRARTTRRIPIIELTRLPGSAAHPT